MKDFQLNKIIVTAKNFKKTAYHHYGNNLLSIPKFIYVSLFKINTFIVVSLDLDKEFPYLQIEKEYKVLKPTIQELETLRTGKELPREFYYDRIHGVKTCYIVLCGDEIAYIHWVYLQGDYNRFLKLSKHVAELNYNTTLPKFRGKKLMAKMVSYICNDLQKQGYKKIVGVASKDNPAALKSVKRAGWEEIGTIKTFGPFNRRIQI